MSSAALHWHGARPGAVAPGVASRLLAGHVRGQWASCPEKSRHFEASVRVLRPNWGRMMRQSDPGPKSCPQNVRFTRWPW